MADWRSARGGAAGVKTNANDDPLRRSRLQAALRPWRHVRGRRRGWRSFGGELGTGFARMTGARIPWTVSYDEVLTVFEGRLRVHAGGAVHELGPRDSLWIPRGTELVYEAEDCLVHYAIHPVKF